MLNKKISIIFIIIFALTNNCSFDNKTGIWGEGAKEKKRISELENNQKEIIKVEKIFSSDEYFSKNILLRENLVLTKARKNSAWEMPNSNYQNYLGNIYLPGIDNIFLKKKIGKNKFSLYQNITPLLVFKNNIFFSDDTGTIFYVDEKGKIIWKKNIYKKAYKKIYKNLVFSISGNNIYVADNIGFVYSISINGGNLLWIRNYEVSIKSNIKVYDNKIFLINQDNKIFCLNASDGSMIWNLLSISSFIKSQNLLSVSITNEGDLVAITSSADIYKINSQTGNILWSRNTAETLYTDASDFFTSSEIVVTENEIIFSSGSNTYSLDSETGSTNWKQDVSSIATPVINGKSIFIVTEYGYFIILDKSTGEIISSSNILKILKKKKQSTEIKGFIMGSGKIYSTTLNGFLIVSSASTGKAEYFKKIGSANISPLIISNGKLYLLTEKSKILVLN